MNELIMPHNAGVMRVLESMKELLALYKNVTGNFRPLLDGERYLTDREVAEIQLTGGLSLCEPVAVLYLFDRIVTLPNPQSAGLQYARNACDCGLP